MIFSPHFSLLWSFPQLPSHYFSHMVWTNHIQTVENIFLRTSVSLAPRMSPAPTSADFAAMCCVVVPAILGNQALLSNQTGGGESLPLQKSEYFCRNFKNGSGHLFQESVVIGPTHERTGSYEWQDSTSTSALAVEKFLTESFFFSCVCVWIPLFSLSIPSLVK